ncbi:hypothetical protein XF_1922 [Xylella fastidiosa 9a5c]|uniref:Uncharacterized protein n=1 Tax=Xylella fastidiosa (strain 9a5c) TaxID=160492 RepID=Q9PC59_XYLFA|nr:hypothetical protein XF_1922 [Xylella fastidiosa 9a5c]
MMIRILSVMRKKAQTGVEKMLLKVRLGTSAARYYDLAAFA